MLTNWEQIKRAEPGYEDRNSILDGIPPALPALMRALEVSKRVVKVGFEWPTCRRSAGQSGGRDCRAAGRDRAGETDRAADELGDLLFTLVNVARQLKDRPGRRPAPDDPPLRRPLPAY